MKRFLFVMLFVSLVSPHVFGQYTNLVFEGAGVRGVAYAGVIQELEQRNLLANVQRVGGTSAGAIAALTLSLGYTGKEIEDIIYTLKLQRFNDGKFFFIGGVSRLRHRYGWYRGKAFIQWLEDVIAAKTGDADITFKQLHDRHFRDLYVTGTSLNHQKLIVFSHEHYPDMKVKDAVRISMSIPLYFEAVCIDSVGHVVDHGRATTRDDIMVDGGFMGNYPIFMFDSIASPGTRVASTHTLGFRIDTPAQIQYDTTGHGLAPIDIDRFNHYIGAFYTYVLENLNRSTLTDADWKRTVSISSGTIGPKIRKLSVKEKDMLMNNGRVALRGYLEN